MAARQTRSSRHRVTPDKAAAQLGARVKARRLALDFSFDAFVEELGMGRGYLSELERGLVVPSLTTLIRLATALETTPADLVLQESERELLFALTEGVSSHDLKTLLSSAQRLQLGSAAVLPFRVVSAKHRSAIPFFRFRPTAGAFSTSQSIEEKPTWVSLPRGVSARKGLLIVQVDGRSMEPSVPDGAYGLFQRPWAPRAGEVGIFSKIESGDETHARYTLKEYRPFIEGGVIGGSLKSKNPAFAALKPDPAGDERPFAQLIRVLR